MRGKGQNVRRDMRSVVAGEGWRHLNICCEVLMIFFHEGKVRGGE